MQKSENYISEYIVTLTNDYCMFFAADQLLSDGIMGEEEQKVSNESHIYIICQRPAVRFDPVGFSYVDGFISGRVVYSVNGLETKIEFREEFALLDGAVNLRLSGYPHREVQTFDALGNKVRHLPASFLAHKLAHMKSVADLKNLKVLYIGQSFASGKSTAVQRLRSHSTFQKILADVMYNSPDSEIYLVTLRYPHYDLMISMDGRDKAAISDERDTTRMKRIVDNPLKKGQQVSLAEAALIRYFQPEYNVKFKTQFPSKGVRVLDGCFDLDFAGLSVSVDTSNSPFLLFSATVEPKQWHNCSINLVTSADRRGFFKMADGTGGYINVAPHVINMSG